MHYRRLKRFNGTDSVHTWWKKSSPYKHMMWLLHNIFYGEIMNMVHPLSPCRRCAVHFAEAGNCYTINQLCQALELVELS